MLKIIIDILTGRLVLIPIIATSTLLVSSAMGPAGLGFVTSVITISSVFATAVLGPATTLLLKKPARSQIKPTLSIKRYFMLSGIFYFSFLGLLFLIGDSRVARTEALLFLVAAFPAGLNGLLLSYFFSIKKLNIFNFHSIIPELLYFCIICLFYGFYELTINTVLFAWLVQMVFICLIVFFWRKALIGHVFIKKYLRRDYISLFFLGLQNTARDRLLLIMGPLAFSLTDLGKLAFYMAIARIFISINGTISNLIMTMPNRFRKTPKLINMWILLLFLISVLFYFSIWLLNQTSILTEFHISNARIMVISISLFGSLVLSVLLRKVYVDKNLQNFSNYQLSITIFVVSFVFLSKNYFDIFTIHMLVVSAIMASTLAYILKTGESRNV